MLGGCLSAVVAMRPAMLVAAMIVTMHPSAMLSDRTAPAARSLAELGLIRLVTEMAGVVVGHRGLPRWFDSSRYLLAGFTDRYAEWIARFAQ
jgi:hypothetical protein